MEYIVNLFMHSALQLEELRMLCQLIQYRYPKGETTIAIYDDMLRISFGKDATIDQEWSEAESNFFDGLKLMGLIVRWQATESSNSAG
jgi:hypothetical protein